jgi:ribonuclease BN (tRNA processing enzyme)
MNLKILGCSGGIGALRRTTSFLLGHHTLLDAGTGVMDLTLDEICAIDQVFLTHCHLDHIVSLAFMTDIRCAHGLANLQVIGLEPTLKALQQHIFNGSIWPDFSQITVSGNPCLTFKIIELDQQLELESKDAVIWPLPAQHTVAACGYAVASNQGSIAFSGDSGWCPGFWRAVNSISNLRHLIVEASFPESESRLARLSEHMTAIEFCRGLGLLTHDRRLKIHVTHLKPGQEDQIVSQIRVAAPTREIRSLVQGESLVF